MSEQRLLQLEANLKQTEAEIINEREKIKKAELKLSKEKLFNIGIREEVAKKFPTERIYVIIESYPYEGQTIHLWTTSEYDARSMCERLQQQYPDMEWDF